MMGFGSPGRFAVASPTVTATFAMPWCNNPRLIPISTKCSVAAFKHVEMRGSDVHLTS